jgi:hypothetical protein
MGGIEGIKAEKKFPYSGAALIMESYNADLV